MRGMNIVAYNTSKETIVLSSKVKLNIGLSVIQITLIYQIKMTLSILVKEEHWTRFFAKNNNTDYC